jgi:hypothetical protein
VRRRSYLILLLVFACGAAGAATNALGARLKTQLEQAVKANNANGAGALLGILNQTLEMINQQGRNILARREWEELAQDAQEAVAKFSAPEAQKVLVEALEKAGPAFQALMLEGMTGFPADIELDRGCQRILEKAADPQLTVACLDLLAAHQYREAMDDVAKLLRVGEPLGVQIAACRALAGLRDRAAVPALIAYLRSQKGGRLRFEATGALRALTGQTFHADAATWENWWASNAASCIPPPAVGTTFNYELQGSGATDLTYYEIPVTEQRLLFVIDTSGSMAYGGKPCRLDKAREELKDLISRLDDSIQFNILLFASTVRRWQKAPLVRANAENRKRAVQFLDSARAGGATSTMSALEEALCGIAADNWVEAIFLLTDGAPTPMFHTTVRKDEDYVESNEAHRRRMRFINRFLKVRINTIGVYTRDKRDPEEKDVVRQAMRGFLQNVAADNDGLYREVP